MFTQEIIPNVYQLSIRAVNVIVIAEERLTLVDTGLYGSSAQIVDFISHLGRSVEEIGLIIITHNHFDHIGGLAELKEPVPFLPYAGTWRSNLRMLILC